MFHGAVRSVRVSPGFFTRHRHFCKGGVKARACIVAVTMTQYGRLAYWTTELVQEARYEATENHSPYEWYQGYDTLKTLLTPSYFAIASTPVRSGATMSRHSANTMALSGGPSVPSFPNKARARVLILGCGNSTFGRDMRQDGWSGPMLQVDWSVTVIEHMRNTYPTCDFLRADITAGLPYADETFDLIVCKGTLDAVLCSEGSVFNVQRMVAEAYRLLAKGHGVFFIVTTGTPDNRTLFLERNNELNNYWQGVGIHALPRPPNSRFPGTDYVYICRKRLAPPARLAQPDSETGGDQVTHWSHNRSVATA